MALPDFQTHLLLNAEHMATYLKVQSFVRRLRSQKHGRPLMTASEFVDMDTGVVLSCGEKALCSSWLPSPLKISSVATDDRVVCRWTGKDLSRRCRTLAGTFACGSCCIHCTDGRDEARKRQDVGESQRAGIQATVSQILKNAALKSVVELVSTQVRLKSAESAKSRTSKVLNILRSIRETKSRNRQPSLRRVTSIQRVSIT